MCATLVSRLLWFYGFNGCVGTCMHFSLLFEPLKIYHHTDDLLQAVNRMTLARENIFCTHPNFSQIVHVETEAIITNKCVPRTPLRSGSQAIVVFKGLQICIRH